LLRSCPGCPEFVYHAEVCLRLLVLIVSVGGLGGVKSVLAATCLADESWIAQPPDAAMRAAAAGLPLPREAITKAVATKSPTNNYIDMSEPRKAPTPAKADPALPYAAVFNAIQNRDYSVYLQAVPRDPVARDALVRGTSGYDPLRHAVERAVPEIVRDLVSRGAPLNETGKPTREGKRAYVALAAHAWETADRLGDGTPSQWAPNASVDYIAITRFLLEKGADPNATHWGDTALDFIAGSSGSPVAVELAVLLLSHGATLDAVKGGNGYLPLLKAINRDKVDLARAMLRYGNASRKQMSDALLASLRVPKHTLAIELLDLGADPDLSPSDQARTGSPPPVAIAVFPMVNDRELAKAFIRHRVNPNVVLNEGTTPLMMVVHDSELMKGFLDLGAKVDVQDNRGDTALHWATRVPTPDMVRRGPDGLFFGQRLSDPEMRGRSVELLLAYRADPNRKNKNGDTPLMQTTAPDGRAIAALVKAGATIDADESTPILTTSRKRDPIGPIGWALIHWNDTLAEALVKRARKVADRDCAAFYYAAVTEATATLAAILGAGGQSRDIVDTQGRTPFIAAASRGSVRSVRYLLDRRAAQTDEKTSPHVQYSGGHPALPIMYGGQTALMLAAAGGHTEVVRVLLEQGADPTRLDNSGASALRYANRGTSARGANEIIRLLRERGARD